MEFYVRNKKKIPRNVLEFAEKLEQAENLVYVMGGLSKGDGYVVIKEMSKSKGIISECMDFDAKEMYKPIKVSRLEELIEKEDIKTLKAELHTGSHVSVTAGELKNSFAQAKELAKTDGYEIGEEIRINVLKHKNAVFVALTKHIGLERLKDGTSYIKTEQYRTLIGSNELPYANRIIPKIYKYTLYVMPFVDEILRYTKPIADKIPKLSKLRKNR